MAVRNYSDIGENAMLIVKRLLANQRLMRLLYYTDKDPLAPYNEETQSGHIDVSEEIIQNEIFGKLVKIIPRFGSNEYSNPMIAIEIEKFLPNYENPEFKDVIIGIEVLVPLSSWIVKDVNLRPFLIMGEIEKSLKGKTINGLGKMETDGARLNFNTDEVVDYKMTFVLTSYD